MLGLISGSGSGSYAGLFGGIANAIHAGRQAGAVSKEDGAQAVEASREAETGETVVAAEASAVKDASSKPTAIESGQAAAANVKGPEVAAQAVSRAMDDEPETMESLEKARAQALATQESFMKSLVIAQMGAGADEDGLAQRLRRGAEGYATTRASEAGERAPQRASVEA